MACETCGDRAWALLEWLGFTLDEVGRIVWATQRGSVLLNLDLKRHPTRTTILALIARVIL